MTCDRKTKTLIDEAVDREKALRLLKGAVAHSSITGNEANFVDFLHQQMDHLGLEPEQEDFLPGRPNLWGIRSGQGNGKRLQFIGHTDTVHVEGWREHWRGTSREDPFGAVEVDGAIWGRGVTDLKGGICSALAAVELLNDAGITLRGDVAFAFVGDEESGEDGTGISAGMTHWSKKVQLGEIARSDFTIYVEPTNLSVYTAQIGFFIAEVKVTGRSAYFGRPDLGIDALKATHAILSSVWLHAAERESLEPHPLTGRSSVLVTGLAGGGYIAVPGECNFSVIGSLRPGDTLDEAVAAFETAIRSTPIAEGIAIEIAYPAGRDHPLGGTPAQIDADQPEVSQLQNAVSLASPGRGAIGGAPFWSESSFIVNQLKMAAVYCAPGDIACCHTSQEHLDIEEYLAAIRAFAYFIVDYCGTADN